MTGLSTQHCFEINGWSGLQHQRVVCETREEIDEIIVGIDQDLAKLEADIAKLEARYGQEVAQHRHYQRSKIRHGVAVEVLNDRTGPVRTSRLKQKIRPATAPRRFGSDLPASAKLCLDKAKYVLAVGLLPFNAEVESLFRGARSIVCLAAGEGVVEPASYDPKKRYRAGRNSFAHWLAFADEGQRRRVDVVFLGHDASAFDAELLFGRLTHGALVITDFASRVAAAMTACWPGEVYRWGEYLVWVGEPQVLDPDPEVWPKISVVTVSYNQAQYLEDCLRSVIEQDYPNLEYIVIDGGSTDGSAEILKRYSNRISTLVIEPDEGQSDGLCKGFRHATGDIFTWINSDDLLAPGALKKAAKAFARHDVDLVAGTCERIDSAKGGLLYRHYSALPTLRPVPFKMDAPIRWTDCWQRGDFFFQPEVFFTRDLWERAGAGLKTHLYWAMDWDLWLRCAAAGARIVRIPDVLGASRVHAKQKTTTNEFYLPQIAGILCEYRRVYSAIAKYWDASEATRADRVAAGVSPRDA